MTRPAVDGFFDAAWAAFEEAQRRIGRVVWHQRVGHAGIRLTFAGSALPAVVGPALTGALPGEWAEAPAFEVGLWDSVSSGVPLPPSPWEIGDFTERGDIRQSPTGNILASFCAEGPVVQIYRARDRRALWWTPDASRMPGHEHGAPARLVLAWGLAAHGLHAVHAGSVGTSSGAVLLTGRGGSGKSNTAIGCLEKTVLSYLSDDYCVVSTGVRPTVHSLYATAKLRTPDLARWPRLSPIHRAAQDAFDKSVMLIEHDYPGRLLRDAPIAAILMPRVDSRRPSGLRRASSLDAVLAVGPSTTSQAPPSDGGVVRAISALARAVPCYHLDIHPDDAGAPPLIAALLARL